MAFIEKLEEFSIYAFFFSARCSVLDPCDVFSNVQSAQKDDSVWPIFRFIMPLNCWKVAIFWNHGGSCHFNRTVAYHCMVESYIIIHIITPEYVTRGMHQVQELRITISITVDHLNYFRNFALLLVSWFFPWFLSALAGNFDLNNIFEF